MGSANIVISYADGRTEQRALATGVHLIGREVGEIVLGDPNASGRHAQLEVGAHDVTITDLGSTNGTFAADGMRLAGPHSLRPGEPVRIGRSTVALVAARKSSGTLEMEAVSEPTVRSSPTGSGVFISHVAEDSVTALKLAYLLEQGGFPSWCYELDSIPGVSHIKQTLQAIEEADAFALLISSHCVESHEVTTELTRAQDLGKVVIPLLYRISHEQLMQRRSEWGQRLGNAACLDVSDLEFSVDRLLSSLRHHGVRSGLTPAAGQRRLETIGAELTRKGARMSAAAPSSVAQGPAASQPGISNDKGRRFPNAARRIDEVSAQVRRLLERDGLEVQVLEHGGQRLIQGRPPHGDAFVNALRKGFGLERAATIKLEAQGYDLSFEVGDGKWADKAVGGAVGMLVFWPAAFTTGWGVYKQQELMRRIEKDVALYLADPTGKP